MNNALINDALTNDLSVNLLIDVADTKAFMAQSSREALRILSKC